MRHPTALPVAASSSPVRRPVRAAPRALAPISSSHTDAKRSVSAQPEQCEPDIVVGGYDTLLAEVRRADDAKPGERRTAVQGPTAATPAWQLVERSSRRKETPSAASTQLQGGGELINRIGIIAWDGTPAVRLRSSPSTDADNVIASLGFNTRVQVIERVPGDWYFVSTQQGALGYVASAYVKTNLPEPNASLHRVEAGRSGYAISIAEQYYGPYSDDWGDDLRFYVAALSLVNGTRLPDTPSGWKSVAFFAGDLIWIPSHGYTQALKGVVNSGSLTYNLADSVGVAGFAERAGELWDDLSRAVSLSAKYIPAALARHVEQALCDTLLSLVYLLVGAAVLLATTTAIGAGFGALAGGVGAAPGAAAGFEIGIILCEWLGLGFLVHWIITSLVDVGSAFGAFLGKVWSAKGDAAAVDQAAQQLAEALGKLMGVLVEALVMYASSAGISKAVGMLRGTRFGREFNNTRLGEWLNTRVKNVRAEGEAGVQTPWGEVRLKTPESVFKDMYRSVDLFDARGSKRGEFDGIDLGSRTFFENKSATGLDKVNPRTGLSHQNPAQWADNAIYGKTVERIKALLDPTTATGKKRVGQGDVPSIADLRGFRKLVFLIDGESPALRAAVHAALAKLKAEFPDWTFTAVFGWKIEVPPVHHEHDE